MDRILIVEDDDSLREVMSAVLQTEGYGVEAVADAEQALSSVKRQSFSCILSDFKLPAKNGLELLKELRDSSSAVPFLMMTAYGSIDIAVEAMKLGANDFLCKPFEPSHLSNVIRDVISHKRILDRSSGSRPRRERPFQTSDAITQRLLQQARKVAKVDTSVLILGESGTGKELIARMIHDTSQRSSKPFLAVNCAAMPADLLESEFFGHEAGAFTGATQSRMGVFEIAAEGTIFLDEIGDMPLNLQVKLLRALQEKEIKRVGGNKIIKAAPRILAATHQDIEDSLESGRMRQDFYYRIAVVTLHLRPLRERKQDIGLLADAYMKFFSESLGKPALRLDPEARELLMSYRWPGNARELENVIERASILAEDVIGVEHLGINPELDLSLLSDASASLSELSAKAARKVEVDLIIRTLHQTMGNKTKAAQILGVSYKTLLNKVKEYELEVSEH